MSARMFKTDEAIRQRVIPLSHEEWYENHYRVKAREIMSDNGKALIRWHDSPLLVPKEQAAELKRRIVYSLAGIKDLGTFIEPAASALAQLALSFDLNPFNQELWVLPQKRGDAVTGFSLFVGYKGLHRAARRVAREELHTDFIFGKAQKLDAQELVDRGADRCFRCNGTGKLGKSYNCYKCDGKGKFDPKDVIAIRVPVALFSKKKLADAVGIEFEPTWGIGIWQPGDNIAEGRDPEWQATKRAKADALRQEFDLPFSYGEHGTVEEADYDSPVVVIDPNQYEPHPYIEAARIADITYDDEAAFVEVIDSAIQSGFESAGHVMEALHDMEHTHLSAEDLQVADVMLKGWFEEQKPAYDAWKAKGTHPPIADGGPNQPALEGLASSEMPADPGNGKHKPAKTSGCKGWTDAAKALAQRVPYYQRDNKPDFYHMTGAAGKLGFEVITDANLAEVIAKLEEYANQKANEEVA